ncbi:MAG: hypothetical protein L0287_34270 [Anaerolineae bacterium]|nr:hypothetical protein [Anaerolineae bacterium]
MNTAVTTNQGLVTILLVLLILLLVLLTIGIVIIFVVMSGGMMMGGMMNPMMGMNGQTMNDMMSACAEMMQNFQRP